MKNHGWRILYCQERLPPNPTQGVVPTLTPHTAKQASLPPIDPSYSHETDSLDSRAQERTLKQLQLTEPLLSAERSCRRIMLSSSCAISSASPLGGLL